MEGGVHFVGVLGEEGEDRGTVLNLEGMNLFFDFDAAGHFVIKAFPDDGGGYLLLEFVLSCVGVVEDFLIEFFVAGVDVDFVADEVVTDDCVDANAVGDAEGFANPVVAYRGVAGVEAVVVFAVLDEFCPELLAALVAGLSVVGSGLGHLFLCRDIFLDFGVVEGFGDVAEDIEGFGWGDVEEFPAGADAQVRQAVDGLVDQAFYLGVFDGLEGSVDFEGQRDGGVVQLFGADIHWAGTFANLHPVFLEGRVGEYVDVSWFFHILLCSISFLRGRFLSFGKGLLP